MSEIEKCRERELDCICRFLQSASEDEVAEVLGVLLESHGLLVTDSRLKVTYKVGYLLVGEACGLRLILEDKE